MKSSQHARRLLIAIALGVGGCSSAVGQSVGTGTGTGTRAASEVAPRIKGASLADPTKLRERLGISPAFDSVPASSVDAVKVAVLDYGFEGITQASGDGRYLPTSAEVVEDFEPEFVRRNNLGDPDYRKAFEPGNRHGRDMAQIIWALAGSRPLGPKFYLLNANGPTMLRRAVRFAVEKQVDIILFSGSFDGGGNGDGRGPIDRIVDEAVGRGIMWINATGNYGGHVFDAPIRLMKDGFLKLRSGSGSGPDPASIRFVNRVDENVATITLTWTDYRDLEDAGTDKDLDLLILDPTGRQVGSGTKVQLTGAGGPKPDPDDTSRNPRERVVLSNLAAFPVLSNDPESAYRIKVRAKTGRFLASDRLRILVSAARESYVPPGGGTPQEALTLLDASNRSELYPPADHTAVFTVGDAGPVSSVGPTLDGRIKPDAVLLDSRVDFTDGMISAGSSNAAAEVAGVAVILKAAEPRMTPRHLFRIARGGPRLPPQADRAKLNLHLWQTPTQSRLSEIIRAR